MVFDSDFPSSEHLLSSGVRAIAWIHDGFTNPEADLATVLKRWQKAGTKVLHLDIRSAYGALEPLKIRSPGLLWLWCGMLRMELQRDTHNRRYGSVARQSRSG